MQSTEVRVGVGEIVVRSQMQDVIKAYALGSCVAVIFFAREFHLAGMAHVALPDSGMGNGRQAHLPGYFADKAIPALVEAFKRNGVKRKSQIQIKLAGGARLLDPNAHFYIGKRNVLAIKKTLWHYKLGAIAEDVGKDYSRTVTLRISDGRVNVDSPGRARRQL